MLTQKIKEKIVFPDIHLSYGPNKEAEAVGFYQQLANTLLGSQLTWTVITMCCKRRLLFSRLRSRYGSFKLAFMAAILNDYL